MKTTRMTGLLMTTALVATIVPGHAAENGRVIVVRQSVGGPGAIGFSASIELHETIQPYHTAPAEAGSVRVALHPGYLAAPADRFGPISRERMRNYMLGIDASVEPAALDFAGNRDGRVDIGDLVTGVRRQLP